LDDAPPDYLAHLRQTSLKYALKLAEIWSEVANLGVETPIKDSSIAACAYQCAKIVTSLSGVVSTGADFPEISAVKAVDACLNILQDLRSIYPVVEIIHQDITRMSQFQSASLQDSSPHPLMSRHSVLAHAQEMGTGCDNEAGSSFTSNQASGSIMGTANNHMMQQSMATENNQLPGNFTNPGFTYVPGLFDMDPTWALGSFDSERQADYDTDVYFSDLTSSLFQEGRRML